MTVVDLPDPLGPSSPKTSPLRTSKSTLSTALALGRPQKSLKILVSPRTATMVWPAFGRSWREGNSATALMRGRGAGAGGAGAAPGGSGADRARPVRFQFLALPHQPGAVEDHHKRADHMQDGGDNRVDEFERGQDQAADDEENAHQKILVDDRPRLARKPHQERQPPQVVVHQRDRRAVDGHFAPGRAHGDPQVPGRQGRRVIDAVADDRHAVALGLELADELDLVLRQALAPGFFAADFAGHPRGHRLTVAGHHGDAAHAADFEAGQRLARLGPGLVLQADPADAVAVAGDKDQAESFRFIQINRLERNRPSRPGP